MKVILEKNVPNFEVGKKFVHQFGREFLHKSSNFTIFWEGGLGAGKTSYTKEILSALGCSENVTSPTFSYMNEYDAGLNKKFVHFDFYRLSQPTDFFHKGMFEVASDPEVSCFVEWGANLCSEGRTCFTGDKFYIKISHGEGVGMRKLRIAQ